MFRIITLGIILLSYTQILAQNPSAVFELESTDQGILIPRTDTATVNAAYPTPATGLLIFQNSDATFYFYDGTKWKSVGNGTGALDLSNTSNDTQRTISISGGGSSTTIDVDDGDSDDSNEIQGIGSVLDTDNDVGFRRIRRIAGPQDDLDAANRIYVDNRATPWQKLSGFIRYELPVILGTSDEPKATLHVDGNDDVLFGNDTIGTGKKLIWNATKGGLRAGDAGTNNSWDADSIGTSSTAFGEGNLAKGRYSMSWGQGNRASGDFSTAWGQLNEVIGSYNTAWGAQNNIANGQWNTVWGSNNQLAQLFTTAWGTDNEIKALGSTVWGTGNKALSIFETVLGSYADTLTTSEIFGWDINDYLFVIGNGLADDDRNNALTVYKSGDVDIDRSLNVQGSDSLQVPDLKVSSGPSFNGPARLVLKRDSTLSAAVGTPFAKLSFNGQGQIFNNQGPLEKTGAFIQAVQKGDWRHGDIDRAATSLNFHIQDDSFGSTLGSPMLELEADQIAINTDTEVDGYTKLGNDAPAIKIKKLTGTLSTSANGGISIPFNIPDHFKIISINVLVQNGGEGLPPNFTQQEGKEYGWRKVGASIVITNKNATAITGVPVFVTIMYEQ